MRVPTTRNIDHCNPTYTSFIAQTLRLKSCRLLRSEQTKKRPTMGRWISDSPSPPKRTSVVAVIGPPPFQSFSRSPMRALHARKNFFPPRHPYCFLSTACCASFIQRETAVRN
jgi:hypothetical protein